MRRPANCRACSGALAVEAGAGLLGGTDGFHYRRLGRALCREAVGCKRSQKSAERQCQGLAHDRPAFEFVVPRLVESKGRKQPTSKGGWQNDRNYAPRATHRRPASPDEGGSARLQLQRVAVTTHSVPIMPPGLAARPQVADLVARRRAHPHARAHELCPRTPGRGLQHRFPGLEHCGVARTAGSPPALVDASGVRGGPRRNESASKHHRRHHQTFEVAHRLLAPLENKKTASRVTLPEIAVLAHWSVPHFRAGCNRFFRSRGRPVTGACPHRPRRVRGASSQAAGLRP